MSKYLNPLERLGNAVSKRVFDIFLSLFLLSLVWWIILLGWLISTLDTGANGIFRQVRLGMHGRKFVILKLRTMRESQLITTTVTTTKDSRITKIGALLRRYKLDELPQLLNVLVGDMSFVGPRPDVPGYANKLDNENRKLILSIRPGITGPATLAFRNEEELLANQIDPVQYNNETIYPEKVRINVEYVRSWSFGRDIRYIWKTVIV